MVSCNSGKRPCDIDFFSTATTNIFDGVLLVEYGKMLYEEDTNNTVRPIGAAGEINGLIDPTYNCTIVAMVMGALLTAAAECQ